MDLISAATAGLSPRTLPHSDESERAVLAGVLLDPLTLGEISTALAVGDFYFERHQRIYRAMAEVQAAGQRIDLRTLQARLQNRGDMDAVGGLAYLAGLDVDLPDLGNMGAYIEIVRECSRRRRLIQACSEATRAALDGGSTADEAIEQTRKALGSLERPRSGQRVTVCGSRGRDAVLDSMDFYARHGRMGDAISTGMRRLDGMLLGGFRRKLFYVLGGESGRGKTTLLLQWAFVVARAIEPHGLTVGVVTPEMSEETLDVRCYAALSQTPLADYRKFPVQARATWQQLQAPQNVRASFQPSDIEAFVREERPALFIVDYAQQAVDYSDPKRYTALAALGARCLEICRTHEIPVILGTQVNVGPDREFTVRETKILEHQADVVIFIDVEYEKTADASGHPTIKDSSLRVHKHRHGPTGKIPVLWRPEIYHFEEQP